MSKWNETIQQLSKMNNDQQCEICNKDIHSITTRRINGHFFCIDCGDTIREGLEKITEDFLDRIKNYRTMFDSTLAEAVHKCMEYMRI